MAIGTHGVINLTKAMAVDVDALNAAGTYTANLDAGNFVTTGALQLDTSSNITGYDFSLALPTANATGLWVVKSPAVGVGINNIYDDPTQFFVPAGQPASIAKLQGGVDYIEVIAANFTGGTMCDATTNQYASVATTGLLTAAATAPASGTYFTFVGNHTIDVGGYPVPSVVLACTRN